MIAIVFFSLRFLFEAMNVPRGNEIWRNAWAGGIALVIGLLAGYLLRERSEMERLLTAIALVVAGILANVFLP